MNFYADIKSPLLLWLKAGLFGLLVVMTAVMLLLTDNRGYELALLAICVWSACRFYYFFFYVLDHYVGGDKNASLFAMILQWFRKPNHSDTGTALISDDHATNLFAGLPKILSEELTETLVAAHYVRIERIVSTGQSSPPGFWYDQQEHEWVVVLQGEAVLEFENHSLRLLPGDHVLIPPRQKHRVGSTSHHEPTVWLAVFFQESVMP